MGLAGVARREPLPGGGRCLEKGIHLCTRTRFSSALYVHSVMYIYAYMHATSCPHYSALVIIYFRVVVVVGQIFTRGIREKERRNPVHFFVPHASIFPTIPFLRDATPPDGSTRPYSSPFKAFRGFVLLRSTRG